MVRKLFVFIMMSLSIFTESLSQVDTAGIAKDSATRLVKGFYMSFHELLTNKPSFQPEFSVVRFFKSKTDSTIIGAEFHPRLTGSFWGFSDGEYAYVSYSANSFATRYWRIESIGKYPFFTYGYKTVVTPSLSLPGLIASAVSVGVKAMEDPEYSLLLITDNGRFVYPDRKFMVKLLKKHPEILKSFKMEWEPYEKWDYNNADEPETEEIKMAKLQLIKEYLEVLNRLER